MTWSFVEFTFGAAINDRSVEGTPIDGSTGSDENMCKADCLANSQCQFIAIIDGGECILYGETLTDDAQEFNDMSTLFVKEPTIEGTYSLQSYGTYSLQSYGTLTFGVFTGHLNTKP